jgi:chlorinating enzyme
MNDNLTAQQIQQYRQTGILFPLPALTSKEVADVLAQLAILDQLLGGYATTKQQSQCHLRFKWACDLATHPRILNAVESIIGPDILVHSSTVFRKQAQDQQYVSWHQDGYTLDLSQRQFVSAWIALTDSTINNGCLRVLPKTHTHRIEHFERPQPNNMLGKGLTVTETLNTDNAQDVILQAGQMSFHHANIVHGSQPNMSNGPRIGLAIRYVAPQVQQQKAHHSVILARGHNNFEHYHVQPKPSTNTQQGMAAQAQYERYLEQIS